MQKIKRSPPARALADPLYRQRIKPPAPKYVRKLKHKKPATE